MATPRSGLRLFAVYALMTLVPIAILGIVLANTVRGDLNARGLVDGENVARGLAHSTVDPVLTGNTLADGPTAKERTQLLRSFSSILARGDVLVIRLRDAQGHVVLDPGHPHRGPFGPADHEVVEAIEGRPVRLLTRLNADEVDAGKALGSQAIEVYTPVVSAQAPNRPVGALEVYVPYAPIKKTIDAQYRRVRVVLVLGLLALWSLLAVITWSVTQRLRRSARTAERMARTDLLTGLANRTALTEAVAHTLSNAPSDPLVLMVIDIADFGRINDTLGHANGDEFLQHVAAALTDQAPATATVARIGGDVFGVLVPAATTAETDDFLTRVRATLRTEHDLSGVAVTAELIVGRVEGCARLDPDELLRRADISCRSAKTAPAPLVEYSAALETFDPDQLGLMAELRRAIDEHQLVLHYQPKLEIATHQVVGVEALVRWQHPSRGLLPPGAFVPAAESTELINDVTDWVLDAACAQVARWQADGLALPVAVNVSARCLRDPAFADRVLAATNRAHIRMDLLSLEITETAVVADPVRAAHTLRRLTARGITVSIDDFGTGSTSLAHLRTLPIHELKIDREFVAPLADDPFEGGAIARAVVSLGHELGMRVVAEGVEDDEVLAALAAMGCDIAQGYGIARPADARTTAAWVAGRARAADQAVGASPNAS